MTYFPHIEHGPTDDGYVYMTTLRKLHTDGVWYDQFVFRDSKGHDPHLLNEFVRDIYLVLLCGKVVPGSKNNSGWLVFPVSKLQITEEERLKLS